MVKFMIENQRILTLALKQPLLKFIFVAFTCVMFSACNDHAEPSRQLTVEFAEQALEGLISNRVVVTADGTVLVATDQGAYKSIDKGDSWQLISPGNWNINDIVEIDTLHFMISGKNRETAFLSETFDGGVTWHQLRTNFGAQESRGSQLINRLHWDDNTQTLFGVGIDVLAKSLDKGINWELVSGIWNGFGSGMRSIAYSNIQNIAFYGGQGAIENPILKKVDVYTASEDFIDVTHLLPAPSTIEEIQFDSQNENTLFVSGEGGIITSNDLGATWTPLLINDNSRFYFDFILDERFSEHIYTAGWNKLFTDPQPLTIELSIDGGVTWQQFTHPNQKLFGGVRTMDVLYEGDEAILYFGLYKGGVMRAYLK